MGTTFHSNLYRWGSERYFLRSANSYDTTGLADLILRVWPEESNPDQIARALASTQHLTFIAEFAGNPVGFVDSFWTNSMEGPRWEVDLLAIDPMCRGRRLGEELVRASIHAAGNAKSRALIRLDNIASQKTFARSGFICAEQNHRLYISNENFVEPIHTTPKARLIQVVTMTYNGIWLENSFTDQDLLAARRNIEGEISIAGAVIPADQPDAFVSAERCGYKFVAEYQWWKREGNHEID